MNPLDLINQLARAEDDFCGRRILAPADSGGEIHVRLNGAICKLMIGPSDYSGFGVFETISFTEAILVRDAALAERQSYLELFPRVRLVATLHRAGQWLGTAFSRGDNRFQLNGLLPIRLVEEVSLFDVVECRFDGTSFWFDRRDGRADPRHADGLRKALVDELPPRDVQIKGLSAEHRAAYEFQLLALAETRLRREEAQRRARERSPVDNAPVHASTSEWDYQTNVNRIRESLSHAGAELVNFYESHGSFQVTYRVEGRQFVSSVDKETHRLVSAGVCLSGYDSDFDLASVVGVLRVGMDRSEF